jgi:hypothetical protein
MLLTLFVWVLIWIDQKQNSSFNHLFGWWIEFRNILKMGLWWRLFWFGLFLFWVGYSFFLSCLILDLRFSLCWALVMIQTRINVIAIHSFQTTDFTLKSKKVFISFLYYFILNYFFLVVWSNFISVINIGIIAHWDMQYTQWGMSVFLRGFFSTNFRNGSVCCVFISAVFQEKTVFYCFPIFLCCFPISLFSDFPFHTLCLHRYMRAVLFYAPVQRRYYNPYIEPLLRRRYCGVLWGVGLWFFIFLFGIIYEKIKVSTCCIFVCGLRLYAFFSFCLCYVVCVML